jgi:hypothetical protein
MEKPSSMNLIGCLGCLGYIALYATASAIIAYLGMRPMWAWGLMIVYVIFWTTAMFVQWNKEQKRKQS